VQRRHSIRHLLWRSVVATAGTVGIGLGVYPLGNQLGTAIARARRGRPQPRGLAKAIAAEWAMAAAVSAARPVGLIGLPVVRPRARGLRPVILLHGFAMGRANFLILANRLSLSGLGPIGGFEYWSLGTVPRAAERLGALIEEVCASTGADRVDLVGHSMGGVVGRWFVTASGGAPRVANLVTIGSPHRGTPLSRFGAGAARIELADGSELLARLASLPMPDGVRITTIWSRADGLVSSRHHATIEGADEVAYDDLGHLAMLASGRVAREIVARLRSPSTM
jgi:pimeloyl-ACP methyl ester carboxylesterase